jgi:hypothetical protein
MNRRRVRFAPSTAFGSSSIKISENKKRRKSLHVKGLLASFVAAVMVFQLYATLKQPSASSSRHNEIGMPLTGVNTVAETALRKSPIRHDTNQHASSSLLQPLNSSQNLPAWIQNYLHWHQKQRVDFPGMKLFTDPAAPKLLIRTCLGLCGGLHDRLGQLPWDLYLANQTGRVLLMHWHRPVPLENFLVPGELDWTVPKDVPGFFSKTGVRVARGELKIVRAYPELFQDYNSERPSDEFWDEHLDKALERSKTGSMKHEKVLRHRILGHLNEDKLEERLVALGETDMLHWTPSYGGIFWMFFRPSPAVQIELDTVYQELKLSPGHYSAVHCRVRHPKATPSDVVFKGKGENQVADKTGLPWEGASRDFAVETATRALRCAQTLLDEAKEPVYLFSDSNDLVRYFAHELKDPKFVARNRTMFKESKVDAAALKIAEETNVLAREMSIENAHIDRQKGRDPPAYHATFVDLFLAVHARCVTYGIGYYAVFATKISGISCKLLYQEEAWGGSEVKRQNTNRCEL